MEYLSIKRTLQLISLSDFTLFDKTDSKQLLTIFHERLSIALVRDDKAVMQSKPLSHFCSQ